MAILSSHLLNAITGEHAGDVKITLSNLDRNTSKIILKTNTDEGGRLSENIEIKLYRSCEFEMVIATEDYFKKKNKDIKSFLLDQRFVSGIGNIYASEILFASKINPFKKAKRLNKNECLNIILNSKKILQQAISKGGSSIRDFKDISGNKGHFQKEFKVYQQDGTDCKRKQCKGIIKKKITSNRSTFFCNSCQK